MIINDIIKQIKVSENILIITHVSPDGDTTGSSLALSMAIEKLGKSVKVCFEKYPAKFNFLKGLQNVISSDEVNIKDFDLAIAVDTPSFDRLSFNDFKGIKVITIDHHITNTKYGDLNYVNEWAAATAESIYQFIQQMDVDIDKDMAECLYVGIATDTGGFKYSNTTAITHQVAGDLVNRNIDVAKISQTVFDLKSIKEIRLLSKALNNIELYKDGEIAIISISNSEMNELGVTSEQTDAVVNYARDIEGVRIGIMMREDAINKTKASFRANDDTDVSEIAVKFGGGGHKKAAGCTINKSLSEAKKELLETLWQY